MRVCILRSTGKLLESQGGGDMPPIDPGWNQDQYDAAVASYRAHNLQTLIDNAVAQSHAAEDIEVRFVDDTEFAQILEASKPKEQVLDEANAPTLAALTEIDRKSIRSIREWIAAQPDAPDFLKTLEDVALAERSKILK